MGTIIRLGEKAWSEKAKLTDNELKQESPGTDNEHDSKGKLINTSDTTERLQQKTINMFKIPKK